MSDVEGNKYLIITLTISMIAVILFVISLIGGTIFLYWLPYYIQETFIIPNTALIAKSGAPVLLGFAAIVPGALSGACVNAIIVYPFMKHLPIAGTNLDPGKPQKLIKVFLKFFLVSFPLLFLCTFDYQYIDKNGLHWNSFFSLSEDNYKFTDIKNIEIKSYKHKSDIDFHIRLNNDWELNLHESDEIFQDHSKTIEGLYIIPL